MDIKVKNTNEFYKRLLQLRIQNDEPEDKIYVLGYTAPVYSHNPINTSR